MAAMLMCSTKEQPKTTLYIYAVIFDEPQKVD